MDFVARSLAGKTEESEFSNCRMSIGSVKDKVMVTPPFKLTSRFRIYPVVANLNPISKIAINKRENGMINSFLYCCSYIFLIPENLLLTSSSSILNGKKSVFIRIVENALRVQNK